jgi:type II secretory pathway component PulK
MSTRRIRNGAARGRREQGVVLLVVLFFALLLTSSIATFARRAAIDSMIVRNREAAARAEGLARGGVRLATGLLAEDALREAEEGVTMELATDSWALMAEQPIELEDGAVLRLQVEDMGTRLNLNAIPVGDAGAAPPPETLQLLVALLQKVVDGMPVPPEEKAIYEPEALADNLLDWCDPDDQRQKGGEEDAYYQEQVPPYRSANGPLLSLEELRLVEGFDGPLVDALRPYVTVYPWVPPAESGSGINPNTAPPHVLSLLFFFDGVVHRFVKEDEVRRILKVREEERLVCPDSSLEICTPISEIVGLNPVFPTPSYNNHVFRVVARAQVGEVTRSVEAVLDRGEDPATPRVLSWSVQ